MKVRTILAAACAATSLATFADIRAVTPVQPDADWVQKWWPKRFAEKDALVKQGGAKFVFVGDSITHYFETGAGRSVWEKYFGPKGVYPSLDLGFSADRTEHVLYRIEHGELDGYEASHVVLMIGTNNAGHFDVEQEPPADTVIGIRRILDVIRSKQPKAKIVLCAIFPRGASVDDPVRVRNAVVNRAIRKFADGRNVFWCDFNQQFLRPDGTLPKGMMPDLLHPGALGYEIWASAIIPYFEGRTAATLPPFVPAGELPDAAPTLCEACRCDQPWWIAKLARNRRRVAEDGGAFDVVMLGDSITHYWEIGEGQDESRDIEILEKRYKIMNCGYGGDTVQHLLWRVRNGELTGYKAKLFTLMIGTNNGNDRPEDIVAGIRNVLGEIRTRHPESKVLLTSLLPRGKEPDDRYRKTCAAVNGVIRDFANGTNVVWFDLWPKYLNPDGTIRAELLDFEYLHPNTEGYRVWREALEPVLRDILGK